MIWGDWVLSGRRILSEVGLGWVYYYFGSLGCSRYIGLACWFDNGNKHSVPSIPGPMSGKVTG